MKTRKLLRALWYIAAAIGFFLFLYRISTNTGPGDPVELHSPFK